VIQQGKIEKVRVDDVAVGKRWRKPTAGQVKAMRKSLAENGLIQPIGIRRGEPNDAEGEGDPPIWVLVHGATRLAAAKLAG
jgi:ParB-like chromosome segregation protein Spo0J